MARKISKHLTLGSPIVACDQDGYEYDSYEEACQGKQILERSSEYISIGTIYVSEGKFWIFAVKRRP